MKINEITIEAIAESKRIDEFKNLTKKDKEVLTNFINKEKGNSKLLSSDGKTLEILAMGGKDVATWRNNKIVMGGTDSKSKERIQKAVKKMVPKNIVEENMKIQELNEKVKETPEIKQIKKHIKQLGSDASDLVGKMLKLDRSTPDIISTPKDKDKLNDIRKQIKKTMDQLGKINLDLVDAIEGKNKLVLQLHTKN